MRLIINRAAHKKNKEDSFNSLIISSLKNYFDLLDHENFPCDEARKCLATNEFNHISAIDSLISKYTKLNVNFIAEFFDGIKKISQKCSYNFGDQIDFSKIINKIFDASSPDFSVFYNIPKYMSSALGHSMFSYIQNFPFNGEESKKVTLKELAELSPFIDQPSQVKIGIHLSSYGLSYQNIEKNFNVLYNNTVSDEFGYVSTNTLYTLFVSKNISSVPRSALIITGTYKKNDILSGMDYALYKQGISVCSFNTNALDTIMNNADYLSTLNNVAEACYRHMALENKGFDILIVHAHGLPTKNHSDIHLQLHYADNIKDLVVSEDIYIKLNSFLARNVGIVLTSCNGQLSNKVIKNNFSSGASMITFGENFGCESYNTETCREFGTRVVDIRNLSKAMYQNQKLLISTHPHSLGSDFDYVTNNANSCNNLSTVFIPAQYIAEEILLRFCMNLSPSKSIPPAIPTYSVIIKEDYCTINYIWCESKDITKTYAFTNDGNKYLVNGTVEMQRINARKI